MSMGLDQNQQIILYINKTNNLITFYYQVFLYINKARNLITDYSRLYR
jgi:hypothetical protein